jgi:hypothetical protein
MQRGTFWGIILHNPLGQVRHTFTQPLDLLNLLAETGETLAGVKTPG